MIRPREISREISLFAAKTPTLPPATHTNSYALGSREVILVEPATPYLDEQRDWIAWARSLASQGRTPVAILATHHHVDHVGGLDVLTRELGLPFWAHAETGKKLGDSFKIKRELHEGEPLVVGDESWTVLHTPGHAPGHVCLFNPESRVLVAGDMIASVGTILIATADDGDMALYLEQLARLEALGAQLVLPAHGNPIDANENVFRRTIEHRLMREAKVLAAVTSNPQKIAEILAISYDDTPVSVWPIAAISLEAHLAKLINDGKVLRMGERYQSA